MADYTGTFKGSFTGSFTGDLVGVDYYDLENSPPTITPHQANQITANSNFRENFKANLNAQGLISSSAQVDYGSVSNIPSGIVSSSQQTKDYLPSGVVSSSQQTKDYLPSGTISSSQQITITESQISDLVHYTDTDVKNKLNVEGVISSSQQIVADLPSGTVSSSVQVDYGSISNIPSGIVSSSQQTKDYLPSGVVSSSQQTKDYLPSGIVSSSVQIVSNLVGQDVVVQSMSGSFSGSFEGDGSGLTNVPASGVVGLNLTIISTTNVTASVSEGTDTFKIVSGSTTQFAIKSGSGNISASGDLSIKGSLDVSGSINATNINAGTPTSNDWQTNLDGSYFNNFTKDTDVSEILRFVAGLLSSSAANPTPNTKTYSSISENKSGTSTGTAPAGYVPNDNNIDDIQYLIDKGFASVGGTLFSGKTIYTNTGYSISYSSVAGGSTSVQSSADSQLFGLGGLSSGVGTEFRVSGSHSFSFYQSQTAIYDDTATETSESSQILSNSTLDTTSNGVTLGKIQTVNPAVIPAAFQDGKFETVFSKNLVDWTTETLTSVSASGQYKIETRIGIATGSQSDYTTKTADESIFWAPVSNINTNIGTNTLTISNQSTTALTLTSGSISGAPYVNGGTWSLVATSSGIFEPMYVASTTAARTVITSPTPSNVTVTRTSGVDTLSTSGGTIQTTNGVYSTSGTVRSTGTVPFRTDNFHTDSTYTISGTGTTFTEGGFADTDFTLAIRARNRSNSETTLNTQIVNIHSAGSFGQPAASGSMGYFGGGTTSTTLIEYFSTESYRRVISNSSTLTTAWDEESKLTLGDGGDLQVKPGYLVNPESTNGYWYPTGGYNGAHYKWYLREVDTAATSNKGTLVIDLDPNSSDDFTTFNDTTSGKIAIGVIFGSTAATIYDAVKGNGSYGGTLNGQSTGYTNPFSDSVNVRGDFASLANSLGTLTLGINNPAGQTISGTYPKIWLLIRYKGTPSNTLERITVSVS